jgi:DNA polymerase I-like protein with 3'-5' exonuclease and polymerase domains
MGWPAPLNVIDPRISWMRIDNGGDQYKPGSEEKKGYSLLDAARTFRVEAVPDTVKKYWRDIAIRGAPFTEEEKTGLIRYCRSDVDCTVRVLLKLWDETELADRRTFNQALIFGRFLTAAARCYVTAIPLDMPAIKRLLRYAQAVRLGLIEARSDTFPIYRPDGSFSHKMFAKFVHDQVWLPRWPRTPTGQLSTSEETFEAMGEKWPLAGELGRFRLFIDRLRTFDLPIGDDGRNRVSLRGFGTLTSRNNTAKGGGFIFAQHSVFRYFIQPPKGRALIVVDWSAQELHIVARLSRDPKLIEIVESGRDPYIELAIAAGLEPPGADETTNPEARAVGKIIQLAMLYGAGPGLIADATGMTIERARAFLKRQREVFHVFFAWSDRKARKALACKPLSTPLGWTIRFRPETSTRSPERTGRNFCVQGAAADMMRLLMIRLTEGGRAVCAALHDGFLIECDAAGADAVLEAVTAAMDKCAIDLIGAPIPIKHKIFCWPECYHEGKTKIAELFETIMRLIDEAETEAETGVAEIRLVG